MRPYEEEGSPFFECLGCHYVRIGVRQVPLPVGPKEGLG